MSSPSPNCENVQNLCIVNHANDIPGIQSCQTAFTVCSVSTSLSAAVSGIGVGAAIGALLLAIIFAILLIRRRRMQKARQIHEHDTVGTYNDEKDSAFIQAAEKREDTVGTLAPRKSVLSRFGSKTSSRSSNLGRSNKNIVQPVSPIAGVVSSEAFRSGDHTNKFEPISPISRTPGSQRSKGENSMEKKSSIRSLNSAADTQSIHSQTSQADQLSALNTRKARLTKHIEALEELMKLQEEEKALDGQIEKMETDMKP